MKVRLYRGPFDGKVMNWDGRRELYVTGPKKLSKKKQYEKFMLQKLTKPDVLVYPDTVAAIYIRTDCVHPDGSVFYEWERPRGGLNQTIKAV